MTASNTPEVALRLLHTQVERLQIALRQGHISYWRYSFDDDQLTYWSDNCSEFLGTPQTDVPQKACHMLTIAHPEDRARLERVYELQDDYQIEFRVVHPNGEIRHIRETAEVEFDRSGKAIAQIGICQDVSDLRKTEEALRSANREKDSLDASVSKHAADQSYLFENSPIASWKEDWSSVKKAIAKFGGKMADFERLFTNDSALVRDLADLIIPISANQAALKMYGVPDFAAFLKFEDEDFLTDDEYISYKATLLAFARGEHHVVTEGWEKTADGRDVYFRTHRYIPPSAREDWSSVIDNCEDLTARKTAELKAQQVTPIGTLESERECTACGASKHLGVPDASIPGFIALARTALENGDIVGARTQLERIDRQLNAPDRDRIKKR